MEGAATEQWEVIVQAFNGEPSDFRLLLSLPVGHKLDPGDRIELSVLLYPDSDLTTRLYYYAEGIAGAAEAASPLFVCFRAEEPKESWLLLLRSALSDRLEGAVNQETASLFRALLLGDRSTLDPGVSLAFRRLGLSHILALSGLHLVLLTSLLRRVLSLLRVPPVLSFLLLVFFCFAYALISGLSTSLLRAAVMMTIVECGRLFRRIPDPPTSLITAAALICTLSPTSVYDLGLWLSCSATFGILFIEELYADRERPKSRIGRLLTSLFTSLRITCGATLFTLLLTSLFFGELALISPLANLILAPPLTLVLYLALFSLILGPIPLFGRLCNFVTGLILDGVTAAARLFGQTVSTTYPALRLSLLILTVLLLVLTFANLPNKRTRRRILYSGLLLFFVTTVGCRIDTANTDFFLYCRYDCDEYLIVAEGNEVSVFTFAENPKSLFVLSDALAEEHLTEINTLYLSHYDEETVLFLSGILCRIPIRRLCLLPAENTDPAVLTALIAVAEEAKVPYRFAEAPPAPSKNFSITVHTGFLQSTSHPDTLLRLEFDGYRLFYASAAALSPFPQSMRDDILASADCVILGAHGAANFTFASYAFNKDTTLIVAIDGIYRLDPRFPPAVFHTEPNFLKIPLN